MTVKKSCTNCRHFIESSKECSNIRAEYQMVYGITSVKIGCEQHEIGKFIERIESGDMVIE